MTDTEILDYLAFAVSVSGVHQDAQFGMVTFTLNRPRDVRSFRQVLEEAIAANRADPRMNRRIAERVGEELTAASKIR